MKPTIRIINETGITNATEILVDSTGENLCDLVPIQQLTVRFIPGHPILATIDIEFPPFDVKAYGWFESNGRILIIPHREWEKEDIYGGDE
jgi:hypothetical protein